MIAAFRREGTLTSISGRLKRYVREEVRLKITHLRKIRENHQLNSSLELGDV